MRVLLLVTDSITTPNGGRYHVGPGSVDFDPFPNGDEIARAMVANGTALDVDKNGVVHAPEGKKLCAAVSYDEVEPGVRLSCCLPEGHKGGRHYDFTTAGKKGEALGEGWWIPERAAKPVAAKPLTPPAETPAPAELVDEKPKKRTAKKDEV
jgi:hypothetical protein